VDAGGESDIVLKMNGQTANTVTLDIQQTPSPQFRTAKRRAIIGTIMPILKMF
jgi:hypothetical protein